MTKRKMYSHNMDFPTVAPRDELDFYDIQTTKIDPNLTPYQAYLRMTSQPPAWLKTAFYVRDVFSKFGKVQPIGGFATKTHQQVPSIGEKVDFFDVVEINDQRLVLQATDRHLSVMMAFIKTTHDQQADLILVGSVKTYNFFGKLYMLPVAPAHKVIVRSMFRKLRESF